MTKKDPAFSEANRHLLAEARLLSARLERLSADSRWAHRSSGLRGSLLRQIERYEEFPEQLAQPDAAAALRQTLRTGFNLLSNAAREIRTPDTPR